MKRRRPRTVTGRGLTWSHAWCHETVLERRKEIAPRLLDFVKDGDLTIVEKPGRDVEEVADLVEQCEDSGLLDQVGVDNAGIGAIVDAIVDRGIEYERIVGIPQGYKLMGAIKTVERKLAGRDLAHGGRPLMNWCVGNAKPEPRGSAVLITKQVSGSAKIDPSRRRVGAVITASRRGNRPSPYLARVRGGSQGGASWPRSPGRSFSPAGLRL
jgi:phage terminase large subunit-like protein